MDTKHITYSITSRHNSYNRDTDTLIPKTVLHEAPRQDFQSNSTIYQLGLGILADPPARNTTNTMASKTVPPEAAQREPQTTSTMAIHHLDLEPNNPPPPSQNSWFWSPLTHYNHLGTIELSCNPQDLIINTIFFTIAILLILMPLMLSNNTSRLCDDTYLLNLVTHLPNAGGGFMIIGMHRLGPVDGRLNVKTWASVVVIGVVLLFGGWIGDLEGWCK